MRALASAEYPSAPIESLPLTSSLSRSGTAKGVSALEKATRPSEVILQPLRLSVLRRAERRAVRETGGEGGESAPREQARKAREAGRESEEGAEREGGELDRRGGAREEDGRVRVQAGGNSVGVLEVGRGGST